MHAPLLAIIIPYNSTPDCHFVLEILNVSEIKNPVCLFSAPPSCGSQYAADIGALSMKERLLTSGTLCEVLRLRAIPSGTQLSLQEVPVGNGMVP